jgi:branched-chain amino acid transport system permease protein
MTTSPAIATSPDVPITPPRRRLGWPAGLVTVAVLAVAPFFLATYAATTLTRILVFALLAVSLDLLVGVTGLPSLGHGAYFGVGAYAAGYVAIHTTRSGPVALLVAALVGAAVAAVAGAVAVRAHGVFFLMLTLAIGEVVQQLAESLRTVTGGSNGLYGIPATAVAGVALTNVGYLYWYVLTAFVLGFLVLRLVVASPLGETLRGIRDNEPRMRALGYRTFRYKLAAYVVAGAVAGLAGGLLAAQQRLVTPADAGFETSIVALLAVIIGGAGTLWGPCLGAAVVVLVRDWLGPSLGGHGSLVLGAVFVAVVFLLPGGVAGLGGRAAGAPGPPRRPGGAAGVDARGKPLLRKAKR